MTREEEINKAYDKWQDDLECSERTVWQCACRWADEHPKSPWRDAKKDPPKKTRELELLEDEHDKVVIVCRRFGDAVTAYLDAEEIWRLYPTGRPFYGEITHWMPMPELPKGGEK